MTREYSREQLNKDAHLQKTTLRNVHPSISKVSVPGARVDNDFLCVLVSVLHGTEVEARGVRGVVPQWGHPRRRHGLREESIKVEPTVPLLTSNVGGSALEVAQTTLHVLG